MAWVNKVDSEKASLYAPVDLSGSGVNINPSAKWPHYAGWAVAGVVALLLLKSRRKGK
jgi:hypothetical protein